MIEQLKGTDPIREWYIKFNEIVVVAEQLTEQRIGRVLPREEVDSHTQELTNALIDLINNLNGVDKDGI